MSGNITDQMCSGINRTQAVLVFVTKNYVNKVAGTDRRDNCKKEFQYAELKKSAQFMIPVVMEPSMRKTSTWSGPVAMNLGGTLYVDYSSDDNFVEMVSNLCSRIRGIITPICDIIGPSSNLTASSTVPASSAFKPLEQLTEEELGRWLKSIKLFQLIPNLKEHDVSGEILALCETVEEIVEFGCKTAQARLLFRKVQEAKASGGVSLSLLSDCTPASALTEVPATALPANGPAPASVPAAPGKYNLQAIAYHIIHLTCTPLVTAPLTVPPAAAIPGTDVPCPSPL